MDRCRISQSMLEAAGQSQYWPQYECPFCNFLLRDAVQTSCGHWLCFECAEKLFTQSEPCCPNKECAELLRKDNGPFLFQDRFVRNVIAQIPLLCVSKEKGCKWSGKACELDDHFKLCEFSKLQCDYCSDWIAPADLNAHLECCPKVEVSCPLEDAGCWQTAKMTRSRLVSEHLAGDGLVQHIEIVASALKEHSIRSIADEEVKHLRSQLSEKDETLSNLQTRVKELENALEKGSSADEDRDFRISLVENENYDGTMVWKIPNFSKRTEDARAGKNASIYSLPFYSSRYGYKMCMRMFPLGNGLGRGTHMSVYFVLLKGEYDNLLKWPFTYMVTLTLLNQAGGREVTDKIKPDPLGRSFQKPTTQLNAGSGRPRFVDLEQLMTGGFILEDTVFIKATVDTCDMKHP